jgi:predicted dehydrogenase
VHSIPVQIAGVTSRSKENRDLFAHERGIRTFATFEELCDAVDVIDLCTPPSMHEPLAVAALQMGKHVIVEKPFTGYYGSEDDNFRGNSFSKQVMLDSASGSCDRILGAATQAGKRICYAENWVYAPAIHKEREIVSKCGVQILWMLGGQCHSGSPSPYYGIWKFSGGGSLVGKGCHPLTAALYLKRVEGESRDGAPIRPTSVSARTHQVTQQRKYRDEGFLRTTYTDVEDFAQIHLTFSDGTVADIFACELVLGGVYNWLEVFGNNHRSRCNLNPINALETYNPREELLKDVYIVERLGTKQGWTHPAPDENWQHGYQHEFQDFMESIFHNRNPESNGELARDTMVTLYTAYLSAERHGAEVTISPPTRHTVPRLDG